MDHRRLFADLRAVVVDEVHVFVSGDRGWHLLAVLERLARICGRPIQRIVLSATVGYPDELLAWLRGSSAGTRAGWVVIPETEMCADEKHHGPFGKIPAVPQLEADIQLDHMGTVENAAKVIAALIELGFLDARMGCCLSDRRVSASSRRHFMGLMAVFTAPPEFTVLHGRQEIGWTDRSGPARRPGEWAAAARRAELEGHLDRLEPATLLRRARGVRRPWTLAQPCGRRRRTAVARGGTRT